MISIPPGEASLSSHPDPTCQSFQCPRSCLKKKQGRREGFLGPWDFKSIKQISFMLGLFRASRRNAPSMFSLEVVEEPGSYKVHPQSARVWGG